jgi:hypothetical protein
VGDESLLTSKREDAFIEAVPSYSEYPTSGEVL